MKKLAYSVICSIGICLFSCHDQSCCTEGEFDDSQAITGSWLLYEQGYSPGAGYVVNRVSDNPAQVVVFNGDRTMTSTVNGWTDDKYYQILKDTIGNNAVQVLALFKLDPGSEPKKLEDANRSYNMSFKDGGLRLEYRFCIEGCHLAFRKVKE